MKLSELSRDCGEWLRGGKADGGDVVISCRIRLARNLAGFKFMARMSAAERAQTLQAVRGAADTLPGAADFGFFAMSELSENERTFLLERHLISRDLMEKKESRGVIFDRQEKLSIMINEEDHLRLQALGRGQRLGEIFAYLNQIDDALAEHLDFAWRPDYGYLTACPSNVGTGLRVSAMLHLPALTITHNIEKALRAAGDLHLAVRGYYGEGTRADGDLYQISNQITLGRSEEELISDLNVVIAELVNYEAKAREFLLREQRLQLDDRVWRSYALLREARIIDTEETMNHLSNLRLGSALRILPEIDAALLNRLLLSCQPAHLQIAAGRELDNLTRDALRAELLRNTLQ
jgi:protein arginine kinase